MLWSADVTPTSEPEPVPIPDAYLDEAGRPGAAERVQARLPATLRRIATDNRLVTLAREAYGYATDPIVPRRYKVMGLAALLYLINPFDAIPDVLPGIGYLDDAAALTSFLVAARKIVESLRDAAKDVVSHAAGEAQETFAHRGMSQLCLSLWAATLAASIGLLYTGARRLLGGDDGSLLDPFFVACMASAGIGVVSSTLFALRVWRRWTAAPGWVRERLAYAVVSQVTALRLCLLALPVLVLLVVVVLRVTLFGR
jgi:uncharacterized membrane protein YkvA (DUF1232 family)